MLANLALPPQLRRLIGVGMKPETSQPTKPRKGARSVNTVNAEILLQLEKGKIESANLTEGLAIKMDALLRAVAPEIPPNLVQMDAGIVQRMAQIGGLFRDHLRPSRRVEMARHTSDTVRGWAAFAVGQDTSLAAMARIEAMEPFAADKHFGVREWAWMAVRAVIVENPIGALEHLLPWTQSPDANIRRFASEATRPRGVWAASIGLLRKEPEHGLGILEKLKFDQDRYVEDSVANWLNDAAKDNPAWVRDILAKWATEGVSPRMVKRAARSL